MTGRKLKILHIGNVANYAYNIGKVLQTDRIESHAINWDYYHFASRPEWEEADFDPADIGDHYFPKIPPAVVTGFARPHWYVHGPRHLATLYLIALNERKRVAAWLLRLALDRHLRRLADPAFRRGTAAPRLAGVLESLCLDLMGEGKGLTKRAVAERLRRAFQRKPEAPPAPAAPAVTPQADPPPPPPPPILRERPRLVPRRADRPGAPFDERVAGLIAEYAEAYPGRGFDPVLLRQFESSLPLLQRLFSQYDLVIGYAIDGIWPLMAGRPYMAYEFGTIRNIPFEDNAQGRLAYLTYRRAARTIVTNPDNEEPAKALGLDHFFLPHVINESGLPDEAEAAAFRAALTARVGGDFFVFHPPRQHWDEQRDTNWDKGNDHLFRGFARLVRETAPGARCICVAWGESVARSRQLVEQLGIAGNVVWIEPQPHRRMMRYIAAADVVADQFSLSTFGGIPPKALYLGKPVVTSFDPGLHAWCYAEMPPVIAARDADGIADALARLHADAAYRAAVGAAGHAWYRAHNSNDRIREILGARIEELLAEPPRRG